jgi:hypothetical protein
MAATKSYRSSAKIACIINALTCVFEAPLSSTSNFQALQRAPGIDVCLLGKSGHANHRVLTTAVDPKQTCAWPCLDAKRHRELEDRPPRTRCDVMGSRQ